MHFLAQCPQMTDDSLLAELDAYKAAVVHFSHHANMRKDGVFPDDLQAAILNKDRWPLSCSVLWPDHAMQPCGSVGVIFKPAVASVLSVSNTDAGSREGDDGIDRSAGEPLTLDAFKKTFQVSGAYNEWRVRGAEVVGIFVHDIDRIEAKKLLEIPGLPGGELLLEIGCARIDLAEVFDAFTTLPVFTMTSSGLARVSRP